LWLKSHGDFFYEKQVEKVSSFRSLYFKEAAFSICFYYFQRDTGEKTKSFLFPYLAPFSGKAIWADNWLPL